MIFPFIRFKLDEDGLVKGKTIDQILTEATDRFIKDIKENRPDTEEEEKDMTASDREIPYCLRQFFNGYASCYAFHQLTYRGQSTGYLLNLEKYLTEEQKKWVDSWLILENGYPKLVASAIQLRGLIGERKYTALANAVDPKIKQFIECEEAMYSLDAEDEARGIGRTARISVISMSTFGENLAKKLQYYQDDIEEDFRCTFLNISNSYEVEYLPKTFCERSDLILIVAQEDQFSTKEVTKVLNAFNGKDQLVIGFLNGFQGHDFGTKLTNRVNFTGNVEDFYEALRLLPDMISLPSMISLDFADIKTLVSVPKSFNVKNKAVCDEIDFSDIDLSHSESIIFCVYGDDEMEMETIDNAALQITNHSNDEATVIFGANVREPRATKPRVVILY